MHSLHAVWTRFGWVAPPMPRVRRRALVALVYIGFAAFMATMYAGYVSVPRWPWWLALVAAILFVATGAGFVRLVTAPGFVADTVDRALDERQRQVRDHAYRLAYYALTLVFGFLSLAVMYAAGDDSNTELLRQMALFLPWLTFLPGSLPSAIVAWTEPDLLDDC